MLQLPVEIPTAHEYPLWATALVHYARIISKYPTLGERRPASETPIFSIGEILNFVFAETVWISPSRACNRAPQGFLHPISQHASRDVMRAA